jgi:hypothetical protein
MKIPPVTISPGDICGFCKASGLYCIVISKPLIFVKLFAITEKLVPLGTSSIVGSEAAMAKAAEASIRADVRAISRFIISLPLNNYLPAG